MENSNVNNAKNVNNSKNWFQTHLWLLAAIAGLLVLFGMCGPFVITKPVIATKVGDVWEIVRNKSLGKTPIYADSIFGANGHVVNWPIICSFAISIIGSILALFGKKNNKCLMAAMFIFIISSLMFLISTGFYDLGETKALTGSLSNFDKVSALAKTKMSFGSIWAFSFSLIAISFSFNGAYQGQNATIADITEIAIFCAIAIVLDSIEHYIPVGWNAGGVGFKLIPLYFIALRFGPLYGFIAGGIIFGFITCVIDGYGIQNYPLDYLVAFGSIGIAGFFKPLIFGPKQKTYNLKGELFLPLAVFIPATVRFIGSTANGVVLNYVDSWSASASYNAGYIYITGAISLVVLMIAYGPLVRLNAKYPPKSSKKTSV